MNSAAPRASLALSLSMCFALGACRITFNPTDSLRESLEQTLGSTYDLGSVVKRDGTISAYRIDTSASQVTLITKTLSEEATPYFGASFESIDEPLGVELGLESWGGVLLKDVVEGSSADDAGLAQGDVLLQMGDVALNNAGQLSALIKDGTGKPVVRRVRYLRWVDDENGEDPSWEEFSANHTMGSRPLEVSSTESVILEPIPKLFETSGLGVVAIPAEVTESLTGESREQLMVVSVVLGSPAYLAGFRTKDRIIDCNGTAMPTEAELRAHSRQGTEVTLSVVGDGAEAEHTATMRTDQDINFKSKTLLSPLYSQSQDIDELNESALAGLAWSRRRVYKSSATRSPRVESMLSLLPLGLFTKRVNSYGLWNTESTSYRLLFFFSWSDTRRGS